MLWPNVERASPISFITPALIMLLTNKRPIKNSIEK